MSTATIPHPAPVKISDTARAIARAELSRSDSEPGVHVQRMMDDHAQQLSRLSHGAAAKKASTHPKKG